MSTTIRLPTTPVPPPSEPDKDLPEHVGSLCGLLVLRDQSSEVARRVLALQARMDAVVVVDDGSLDDTTDRARAAGARVLRLPSPRGRGVALRAGLRLARELGYIGALVPGAEDLSGADLDLLVRAHARAPEALLVGVGPGQALAGKEWDEVRALAEGRTPEPYPDWRPPKASGWPGQVETAFMALAETRFGYPWGGPRLLPLQAVLRRPLREQGDAADIELLALCVHAGVPTIEVELASTPSRPVVTCRKAALRLIPRFSLLTWRRRAAERFGMGGGYAPPTTSPLGLLLGLGLLSLLAGCPKVASVAAVGSSVCPAGLERSDWPGAGDADAARDALLADREPTRTAWVEQDVRIEVAARGTRRLSGVLAQDGADRTRMRLLAPAGLTVLDYVQAEGRWQLTMPTAGIARSGLEGEPPLTPEELEEGAWGLRPEQVVGLLRSIQPGAAVRWQEGACAVLEELDAGAVVRRIGFAQGDASGPVWIVAREELVTAGQIVALTRFDDYRSVGEGRWPFRSEVVDLASGSVVTLTCRAVRTEGITDAFFAMTDDLPRRVPHALSPEAAP